MKFLIVYSTVEGQTHKIALFMEEVLQKAGHSVDTFNATESPPAPDEYDAVLLGSSIHIHKYHSAIIHYATQHSEQLNNMPSAFFSVCMAVASDLEEEHEEVAQICTKFLKQAGWQPLMTTQIAGALKYTQYDFFKRLIMKMIAKKEGGSTDTSKDHEYTDWSAVRQFVIDFAAKASQ